MQRNSTVATHHIQRNDVTSDLTTRGRPFSDVVYEKVLNSSLILLVIVIFVHFHPQLYLHFQSSSCKNEK